MVLLKERQINVKVDSENYDIAKKVFKDKGLNITSAFNLFIEEVANKQDLPFKTVEEKKREKLIEDLSDIFNTNLQKMKSEGGISLDEARSRLVN